MKATDLGLLRSWLEREFADAVGMSVAVSGSMARGDYRVAATGVVTSDLDLIPVIARAADVDLARAQLAPGLANLANRLEVACTAAITLMANYRQTPHAGYVTSMAQQPFVCDPLGLQQLPVPMPDTSPGRVLPWLVQPITYYLAKSGVSGHGQNLTKASLALRRLADDPLLASHALPEALSRELEVLQRPGISLNAQRSACVSALTMLVELCATELLPSSSEFLKRDAAAEPRDSTFLAVRNLTFLENQGLPFEQSAMRALPS
ncbi:hypothetical protein GCM10010207_65110 [Streptomyces atratus]|uniref:hypothetical protein n=1 Tax=Streptomyces atratus TaxID=1893 RepID=UPI0016710043|nr:hypothetical protein [Streptomyces atratus]GGT56027.1 hypothetical protein GCM10010207_65110 [Streptomyces atratus]